MAGQPAGLRSPACFSTLLSTAPLRLLGDMHGHSCPRKRGSGGQNKTKSRLERGRKGTLQWITGHWLYTTQHVEMAGRWQCSADRPSCHQGGPQREMVTSSVSAEVLAPWPWPLALAGHGGEVAYKAVQVPHLRRTASPGPLALQVLAPEGEAWGVTFAHHPHCPVQVTKGSRTAVPAPCKAVVTSCCGVCPGTWCWCTAGGSLSW